MKLDLKSSNGIVVMLLVAAALAVGFWMLLLSPKREEASKLEATVSKLEGELSQHTAEAEEAEEARTTFPVDYQQLVVQINHISEKAGVRFQTLNLEPSEGSEEEATEEESASPAEAGASPASLPSPTEVAASKLPLGAAIGTAGLGVMPYKLTFTGDFFNIAEFIKGLDNLVKTENENVDVTGRLITIDSFNLSADPEIGFPFLEAEFMVTTYLTPPEQGVTAGATAEAPTTAEATPASTTTGGAP
jgi:Tfp pilus assembly protein PilO